jgi:hypothetical protein
MAPVDADIEQRSGFAEPGEVAQAGGEKHSKGGAAHFARRHGKRAMMDCPQPGRMTVDRHVVGRIGEHHRGALAAHQLAEGGEVKRIAAQYPMPA